MNDLLVNHGGLDDTSVNLDAAAKRLHNELDTLIRELDKRKASWTGGAQEAWTEVQRIWSTEVTRMGGILHDLGRTVNNSNVSYMEADRRGAAGFGA